MKLAALLRMAASTLIVQSAMISGAWAHAGLVKAEPAKRAVLARAPKQIKLWFNEAVELAYSKVQVLDASGKVISLASVQADRTEPKLLLLDVPALSAGTYTVKYHVLSVDGHVVDYGYTFTIKGDQPTP